MSDKTKGHAPGAKPSKTAAKTANAQAPKNSRVGIVIPYRARETHLATFLPHMERFIRDQPDKIAPRVTILVVEQEPGKEFNSGKLKNIGYTLLKDSIDYICFHDVDYCPIAVDYRDPGEGWVSPVSHGPRKIRDPRGFSITVSHNGEFTGGALLFAKSAFERINGFSNDYWGWGFEGTDILRRCRLLTLPFTRRAGRFDLLPHIHDGYEFVEGHLKETPAHEKNAEIYDSRFGAAAATFMPIDKQIALSRMHGDGLSNLVANLKYSILERTELQPATDTLTIERVLVAV